ncbi:hypothetical protein DENSPDRAFT_886704 [Dentipellis sp. KUC8613]|nr:hypothetical protein DENSPDRAFT_886704 [Dentipellis sp. KUC8613]
MRTDQRTVGVIREGAKSSIELNIASRAIGERRAAIADARFQWRHALSFSFSSTSTLALPLVPAPSVARRPSPVARSQNTCDVHVRAYNSLQLAEKRVHKTDTRGAQARCVGRFLPLHVCAFLRTSTHPSSALPRPAPSLQRRPLANAASRSCARALPDPLCPHPQHPPLASMHPRPLVCPDPGFFAPSSCTRCAGAYTRSRPQTLFAPSPISAPSWSRRLRTCTPARPLRTISPVSSRSCTLTGVTAPSSLRAPRRVALVGPRALVSRAVVLLAPSHPVLAPVCPPVALSCPSRVHQAPHAPVTPPAPSRPSCLRHLRDPLGPHTAVPLLVSPPPVPPPLMPLSRRSCRHRLCRRRSCRHRNPCAPVTPLASSYPPRPSRSSRPTRPLCRRCAIAAVAPSRPLCCRHLRTPCATVACPSCPLYTIA